MKILIQNGRLLDPASGLDKVGDLAIASGRIVGLGSVGDFNADRVIDATGLVVAPGLVDLAARLREPGHEHEGMLESELAAAAAGGVTSLVCPPDTDPTLDEPGLVDMLKFRARKLSRCRLFPLGALTRGLAGESLTEMAELTESGCVGFSQAYVPIRNTLTVQRAMQYAASFGYTLWLHAQDPWLSGVPVAAETIALHTILELVRVTGCRVHLCRISSAAGVDLVRQAKKDGLPITADVSINSLHLTDVDIGYFNSAMRLQPPLRQQRDRDALRAALADGTIDALVSDHNPVAADEKTLPFAEATPGATGLELLLSLALRWGQDEGLSLAQALDTITARPVKVLGSALGSLAASAGRLVEGGVGDVVVFDAEASGAVTPERLVSQGKHTPFAFDITGFELPGRVRYTLVAGTVAYESLVTDAERAA